MRKLSVLYFLPALLLGGCDDIPAVSDPHNVVVDGRAMDQITFIKRYCQGKMMHPSCAAVAAAAVQDSTRSTMPKGW